MINDAVTMAITEDNQDERNNDDIFTQGNGLMEISTVAFQGVMREHGGNGLRCLCEVSGLTVRRKLLILSSTFKSFLIAFGVSSNLSGV